MATDGTGASQAQLKQVASKISISAQIEPKTSFAHQQNGIPFIRDLRVTNLCGEALENLELTISFNPHFADEKHIFVQRIEAGEIFVSDVVDVSLSGEYLSGARESTAGRIVIECISQSNVVGSYSGETRLLAFDEWAGLSGLPEILAAFSQPNHPAVERVLRSASELLSKAGKLASIEGYQSKDRKRAWEIASAIYGSIANLGLTYANPPASFEKTGQKIRTPDRILVP